MDESSDRKRLQHNTTPWLLWLVWLGVPSFAVLWITFSGSTSLLSGIAGLVGFVTVLMWLVYVLRAAYGESMIDGDAAAEEFGSSTSSARIFAGLSVFMPGRFGLERHWWAAVGISGLALGLGHAVGEELENELWAFGIVVGGRLAGLAFLFLWVFVDEIWTKRQDKRRRRTKVGND